MASAVTPCSCHPGRDQDDGEPPAPAHPASLRLRRSGRRVHPRHLPRLQREVFWPQRGRVTEAPPVPRVGRNSRQTVGIGTDVSVWRRGRPGPVGSPDSTGVPTPTTLTNMLGNVSVVLSWQVWHVWVRAGGEPFILRASGKGLGSVSYTHLRAHETV